MSNRTLAARLLRRGALAAAAAAGAALLLAPAGYAAQYFPTDGTSLATDIAAANSAGGFNQIVLGNMNYVLPSTGITITGNTEITGNPQYQASSGSPGPSLDGSSVSTTSDAITVGPSANVILKALDLIGGGFNSTQPTAAIHVQGNGAPPASGGGNLELDNMAFENTAGNGLVVDPGATATLNNSSILDTGVNAVVLSAQNGNAPTLSLNNSTIYNTQQYGVETNDASDHVTLINSIIGKSNQAAGTAKNCLFAATTVTASAFDDTSCNGTSSSFLLFGNAYNHGPTVSRKPRSGTVISGGNASYCQVDDQSFWVRGSTCSIGAVQTSVSQDTSASAPVCTAAAPVYTPPDGSGGASQTASVTPVSGDADGLGPDVIMSYQILVNHTTNPETGSTASWSTVPGTLFAETSPSAPSSTLLDEPSTSPFNVTASKSSGSHVKHDTYWEMVVQDWLGANSLTSAIPTDGVTPRSNQPTTCK